MERFGVLWTRWGGLPRKLADMVLTPTELRITKHRDAIDAGLPGPSLVHDKLGVHTVVYKRDQWRHLPPQLEALLPPSNRDNRKRPGACIFLQPLKLSILQGRIDEPGGSRWRRRQKDKGNAGGKNWKRGERVVKPSRGGRGNAACRVMHWITGTGD